MSNALKDFRKAVMGMGVVLVGFGAALTGGAADKNPGELDLAQLLSGVGIGLTGGLMVAGTRQKVDPDKDISFTEIQAKYDAANKKTDKPAVNSFRSSPRQGM